MMRADPSADRVTVSEAVIDAGAALARFVEACPGAGAVVSFTGLVRGATAKGSAAATVTSLTLSGYGGVTAASMVAIAADARGRFAVDDVCIIHRTGTMAPGEVIVFVAAAASHRRAAFDAADYMMDRLKTEAVLWKQEAGPGGTAWIEPRGADIADRARWGQA